VRVSPYLVMQSGAPFDITSGNDYYGTTLYNSRPGFATNAAKPGLVQTAYGLLDPTPDASEALVPRNYGRGRGMVAMNLRIGKAIGFGRPKEAGGKASGTNAAPAPIGPMTNAGLRGVLGSPSTQRRYNLSISMSVRNLLNHTNPGPIVGNITSPLFGSANQIAGAPNGEGFFETASNRRLENYELAKHKLQQFPDEHLKNATQQQGVKLAAWLRNWAAYSNPTMARQHRFLLVRDHHPEKLLPPRLTVPEIEAILKYAQRLYPNSWISWTCVEEDKRLRPMNHTSNTRSSGCGSQVDPRQQTSKKEYGFHVSSSHRPRAALHLRPETAQPVGIAADAPLAVHFHDAAKLPVGGGVEVVRNGANRQ